MSRLNFVNVISCIVFGLSIFFCGHSNLVIYNQVSSKLHIWITFIKLSPKFEYGFCPVKDNQDGSQNGCLLSICICGHTNFVIYHPISSKFHKWITLIKLLARFENGFCPVKINKTIKMATASLFASLVDILLRLKSFIAQGPCRWGQKKYLHFHCKSLNEPLYLRCCSYIHKQINLSHFHIRAI